MTLDDGQLVQLAEGVRLFNAEEYFAAHDAWEELWTEYRGPWRNLLKGLIQAAVALYHFQRGNLVGARKLCRTSRAYLQPFATESPLVNVADLLANYPAMFGELLEDPASKELSTISPFPQYQSAQVPPLRLSVR